MIVRYSYALVYFNFSTLHSKLIQNIIFIYTILVSAIWFLINIHFHPTALFNKLLNRN